MRRTIIIAAATAAALTTAGLALATMSASGLSATTATFTATTKDRSETRTCTGDGDTYEITNGRYNGTVDFADPNSDLDGPVSIQVRSVLNKTDGVGYLQAWFRIKDDDRRGHGSFVGTLNGNGDVDGFFQGRVNRKYAVLLGSVSANFTAAGGFTAGKIGNGSTSLPAVLVGRPCQDSKPAGVAVRLVVKGKVSALAATSITVAPTDGTAAQACEIKAGTSPSLDGAVVGTEVEMGCGLVDGKMTLLKLKKHR